MDLKGRRGPAVAGAKWRCIRTLPAETISKFCHFVIPSPRIKRAHIHVYAASAIGTPTLIRVIRLPRRSRAKAGAIHGSLKRKSLSHSTPGKFERSSRNCFPKRAISNLPALERLTGDRRSMGYTGAGRSHRPGDGCWGQPSWG
jgi:hypothetical protein